MKRLRWGSLAALVAVVVSLSGSVVAGAASGVELESGRLQRAAHEFQPFRNDAHSFERRPFGPRLRHTDQYRT